MSIEATIDRFEEGVAVVRLDDGQEILIVRNELPASAHEGSRLVIKVSASVEDENSKVDQARQLLNDLLRGNSK